ncbi:2971_t:CDS:1, partial [Rhizophagus irregularis]
SWTNRRSSKRKTESTGHFPDVKSDNLSVRKAIHSYYKAEIINYELLKNNEYHMQVCM